MKLVKTLDLTRRLIGCCLGCKKHIWFRALDGALTIRRGALGPVCAECEARWDRIRRSNAELATKPGRRVYCPSHDPPPVCHGIFNVIDAASAETLKVRIEEETATP